MALAEFFPGGEKNIGDMLTQPSDPIDVFGRQDKVGRFTHPDTGITVIAKRGEIDLNTTRLIPVFDAAKQPTE